MTGKFNTKVYLENRKRSRTYKDYLDEVEQDRRSALIESDELLEAEA